MRLHPHESPTSQAVARGLEAQMRGDKMIMPAPGDLPVPPRVSAPGAAATACGEPEAAERPAGAIPAPPAVDLTAEQRSILAALGAGFVDGHAAKLVGLSDRTFARRVAELMTLFGATSRFQLGMQAARRQVL